MIRTPAPSTAYLLGQLSAQAEIEREVRLAALIAAHSGQENWT